MTKPNVHHQPARERRRAEVFSDGSVVLIRDMPSAQISVHLDDVGHPEETVELTKQEFAELRRHKGKDLKYDREKKRIAISEEEPDTKAKDEK